MKADVAALGALFAKGPALAAPFHQRPYRWSARRNWGPFWLHWTATLAEDAAIGGRRLNFLGAVVCRVDPDPSGRDRPDDVARPLEVLDGQQRLLTSMMAIKALELHARQRGDDALAASLRAHLFDDNGRPRFVAGRASYADQIAALRTQTLTARPSLGAAPDAEAPPDDENALWEPTLAALEEDEPYDAADPQKPARAEREATQSDWEWDWDGGGGGGGGARLQSALQWFFDLVDRRLAAARASRPPRGAGAERDALARLADGLLERTQIVLITLDGDVSPFDAFERLNNLGEPLSALDLVKNQLFRAAELGGLDRPALEALYRRAWRVFDDARHAPRWAASERRGRENRPAQDWFLRAYLSVRECRNVSMSETLERMHEIARGATDDAPGEIEALNRGARAFAEISGWLDPGPHRVRIDALRRFARFSAEPALIAMRMHLWEDQAATRAILAMLESVAVRRFFCDAGSARDYDVYARLARVIGPGAARNGKHCAREVARRLKTAQRGAFWPKDAQFRRAFAAKKLANHNANQQARDRKAVFRAVFEAIDGAARGVDPSEPTPWRQEGRTIEHLFPLHGRDHWPEIAPSERDLLETIGNLTLIDDALNREIGQAPWSIKRTLLAGDSDVALNALLLRDKRWRREWGPQQIRDRGRTLAALAVTRWPRPR